MSGATKTNAFVLKTQDYRDTSLLCHLYTREFGKVHGIVRGIREGRQRYGSTLEPFSLNEILFYKRRKGADLHQVTQAELLDLFVDVREDLDRLAYASYFIEFLDVMVENEEPSPETFDLLAECLHFLSTGASTKRVARIFEVKFLEILGLLPEIGQCVACRQILPDPAFFNVKNGGLLCKKCLGAREGSSIPVSRGTLNFLEHVKRSQVKELHHVKVAETVGVELEKIMRRFVDFQLPNRLKSVTFLEKLGI